MLSFIKVFPDLFAKEVFFAKAAESDYSIFFTVLSEGLNRYGLAATGMALWFVLSLGWIVAAVVFSRKFYSQRWQQWSFLMVVAVLPGYYAQAGIMQIAESFAGPRLAVEAAVIVAAALLLGDRVFLSLIVLVAAAFIHPLTAGHGLLFWYFFLCRPRRRYVLIPLAAVVALVTVSLFGIPPFSGLLVEMDVAWYSFIERRVSYSFLHNWRIEDFNRIVLESSVIVHAGLLVSSRQRRFLLAALATGLLGLLVTFLGADLLHNVFFTQLQTWRTSWLIHLAMLVALPALAGVVLGSGSFRERFLPLWYLVAMLVPGPLGGILAVAILLVGVGPVVRLWSAGKGVAA
ncbi:MAG: hypothetical protein HQM02_11580, partial [Magnetococcales bacterium]|nr:hypothetical protein [Magnetococcales bacterium]